MSQLARETVKVALSGDGADEALAGYRRYRFFAAEERVRGLLPEGARGLFTRLGNAYPKLDWAPQFLRAKTTLLSLAVVQVVRGADEAPVPCPVSRAPAPAAAAVRWQIDAQH